MGITVTHFDDNHDLDYLLIRTGQRDAAAFKKLYDKTSSHLYAILIRILKDERDAADTLQEVYVTIWNRASRFDPKKGKALAWFAVITRNAGIDALRRRRPGHVSDDNCTELQDNGLSPLEDLNQKKLGEYLCKDVDTLPHNQRDAIRLFYLEERSLNEVAALMDAPLNTAKSWVRRGLENLKTRYASERLVEYL